MTDFRGESARIVMPRERRADDPKTPCKLAFRDGVKAGRANEPTTGILGTTRETKAFLRGYGVGQRARAARGIKTMGDE